MRDPEVDTRSIFKVIASSVASTYAPWRSGRDTKDICRPFPFLVLVLP